MDGKINLIENWQELNLSDDSVNDWRSDLVATLLAERQGDADYILINRLGDSQRGVAKDIEDISVTMLGEGTYLSINVNKAGLYDSLPEGIFHTSVYPDKNKEQVLEEIRLHRSEEEYIRKFFQLFETEIDHNLIEIQARGLHYEKETAYRNFVDTFATFWPTLKDTPIDSANVFVKMIPQFHRLRMDVEDVAQALSLILEVPIGIQRAELDKRVSSPTQLNQVRLEDKAILQGGFHDGNPDYLLTIGDIQAHQVKDFLPGGKKRQILEFLIEILIQADAETKIEIKVVKEESKALFCCQEAPYPCYLGINAYLG